MFAAQFVSAGARALLPRGDALRDSLWSYHTRPGPRCSFWSFFVVSGTPSIFCRGQGMKANWAGWRNTVTW